MKIDCKFLIIVFLLVMQPVRAISVELPIRDLLAGLAICGMIASNNNENIIRAYQIADDMMQYSHKKR